MIELRVTGETADQFGRNLMQAIGLMGAGLERSFQEPHEVRMSVAPIPPATTIPDGPTKSTSTNCSPNSTPEPPPQTSDTLFEAMDQDPKAKPKDKKAKGPKLDDLKTALSNVITAAADRGWVAPRRNAYARKLLGAFGAKTASEVKPNQYEIFMDAALEYVLGDAPEA